MTADEGGDPPCWAHLFEEGEAGDDACTADHGNELGGAVVVDLGGVDLRGGSGVMWSLPHGGDLDVNLVHLRRGDVIAAHVNDEVDVVVVVVAGRGELSIDGVPRDLGGDALAMIPRGSRREIHAGPHGITYLSVHRRRAPLAIGVKRPQP